MEKSAAPSDLFENQSHSGGQLISLLKIPPALGMSHKTSVTTQGKKNSTSAGELKRTGQFCSVPAAGEGFSNDNSFPLWQKQVLLLFVSVNYWI